MGSHTDCTDWDYETHPKIKQLRARCDRLTAWVAKRPTRFARYGFDTRAGHRLMFAPFAPPACTCFAGTFRGSSSCPHLVNYGVGVHGTKVGAPPNHVAAQMAIFDSRCKLLFSTCAQSAASIDPAEAFVKLVLRSIKTHTYQVTPRSNLFQRNTTGAALISAMPLRMRSFRSSFELTRMCLRKVRAIFEKAHSIKLSQEPCLGV